MVTRRGVPGVRDIARRSDPGSPRDDRDGWGGTPAVPPIIGPEIEWFVWSPDGRELLWQELTPLGAEAFRTTVHAGDPEFKGPPRTVKVIDGLIICTPSWQRLEP